ncbi:rRNA processing/ribosome biogenesis-domain-containing protein [Pisolithus marmoratus]|nr:rRNA processing/ribosome biogenesis-domain-containing protein [Pisolithus marmoratus]
MDVPHPLQSILQSFLVSDASAVLFAPQILDRLSSSCLAPSSHLQKWCTRVTSLMHSKDPGARWAGICFAYRTSALSEHLRVEHARSWIGIVLPLLSKPEPLPILKVSMRYLRLVLGAAAGHPEFQRQVAAPTVPKISAALLCIAENSSDANIRALATQVLSQLVMSYPSQHRALSSRLFALCYGIFGGSSPQPTDGQLLNVTADLFSALHYLGGKVGGVNTWRSCLDAVLQASWVAWAALRTTFPNSVSHVSWKMLNVEGSAPSYFGPLPGDPVTANALCLDRLNCNITAICALLRASVQRPVKVPIGNLVAFGYALLACTDEEQQSERPVDPQARALEVASLPQIWMHGYRLLSCLCQAARKLVAPSASRLIMIIACQLERMQENSRRSAFLRIAYNILNHCSVVGSSIAVTRLMKTTIGSLSQLYLPRSTEDGATPSQVQLKTGKKRVRDFQDGDALSTCQQVLCATSDSCNAILVALDERGIAITGEIALNSSASISLAFVAINSPSKPFA